MIFKFLTVITNTNNDDDFRLIEEESNRREMEVEMSLILSNRNNIIKEIETYSTSQLQADLINMQVCTSYNHHQYITFLNGK